MRSLYILYFHTEFETWYGFYFWGTCQFRPATFNCSTDACVKWPSYWTKQNWMTWTFLLIQMTSDLMIMPLYLPDTRLSITRLFLPAHQEVQHHILPSQALQTVLHHPGVTPIFSGYDVCKAWTSKPHRVLLQCPSQPKVWKLWFQSLGFLTAQLKTSLLRQPLDLQTQSRYWRTGVRSPHTWQSFSWAILWAFASCPAWGQHCAKLGDTKKSKMIVMPSL